MYRQYQFLAHADLGIAKESIISVPLHSPEKGHETIAKLRMRLAADPRIDRHSCERSPDAREISIFIDRAKLGVDMLKIMWSQEMTAEQPQRGGPTMKELVESTGRARVILSRIDNDAAVRFGHSMGVTLFQGRHLDTLLSNRTGPLGR